MGSDNTSGMMLVGAVFFGVGVILLLFFGVVGIDPGRTFDIKNELRVANLAGLFLGSTSCIVGAIFFSVGWFYERLSALSNNPVKKHNQRSVEPVKEDSKNRKRVNLHASVEGKIRALQMTVSRDSATGEWILMSNDGKELRFSTIDKLEYAVESGQFEFGTGV